MLDLKRKISSKVLFFNSWHSFEKACHKNEKTLSDSALQMGKAIDISATCKKFLMPISCLRENSIGQVLFDDFVKAKLITWLNAISASDFNFVMPQLFPLNCTSKTSFILLT